MSRRKLDSVDWVVYSFLGFLGLLAAFVVVGTLVIVL